MERLPFLAAAAALALALAGCGGSNDDDARVDVDDLDAGSYVTSLGRADDPTVGRYYAAADGRRLLVLDAADAPATQIYRRADARSDWQATPSPDADVTVSLLNADRRAAAPIDRAALAGRYVTALGDGTPVVFTLDTAGALAPEGAGCALRGDLADGELPDTLKLRLEASGCGAQDGRYDGILTADADYAPAAFRLVGDDGGQVLDLWAYTE